MSKVLDIHEVARYSGISEVTVYRKVRKGEAERNFIVPGSSLIFFNSNILIYTIRF